MVVEILISLTLLFLGIVALAVIHVCIVVRAFSGGNEHIGLSQGNNSETKMSKEDLKKLPCFEYKAAEDRGSDPVDCVVCLENFKSGEKCRLLPNCGHSFHAECIESWLLKTPICPICRTRVSPLNFGVILKEENNVSGAVAMNIGFPTFVFDQFPSISSSASIPDIEILHFELEIDRFQH